MDIGPRIGLGIIDVWSWSLERSIPEVARLWNVLSSEETMRATHFIRERDALRYSTGRGLMRIILGRYLGLQPSAVPLVTNSYGKPQIGASSRPPLQFNLSHSADRAVLAVSDSYAVGIDIEEIKPIEEDIAARFFSRRECAGLQKMAPEDYLAGFYRCWTRKEAFVKALGAGLMLPLDSFDVTVEADAPPRLERLDGDEGATHEWMLANIDTPPGFAGAIAARTRGDRVRLRYQPLAAAFLRDASRSGARP